VNPAWSMASSGGPDSLASLAFFAGFGVCEIAAVTVFAAMIALHMLKKLLSAAGLV
jgi:hypothetical protein